MSQPVVEKCAVIVNGNVAVLGIKKVAREPLRNGSACSGRVNNFRRIYVAD
jgi:hypothetical protein